MNKLNELIKLNNAVDEIINAAMKEDEYTVKEIRVVEEKIWNKMWDDIDEMYKYLPTVFSDVHYQDINVVYHTDNKSPFHTLYRIALFPTTVSISLHYNFKLVKRESYQEIINSCDSNKELIATLLLGWDKTKEELNKKIEKALADIIQRKIEKTSNTIESNNNLLKQYKDRM